MSDLSSGLDLRKMYSGFNSSQNKVHQPSRPRKKRLSTDQVNLLETSFSSSQKLKAEHKLELALQLGLPPKQVAIWYQNRRARHKTNSIEHDYKNMQQELDNALAENTLLQKEVQMLKYELNKAQNMLPSVSIPSAVTIPSVSASSEDHASSSSHGNMIWRGDDASIFPVEDICTLIESENTLANHNQSAIISWLNH